MFMDLMRDPRKSDRRKILIFQFRERKFSPVYHIIFRKSRKILLQSPNISQKLKDSVKFGHSKRKNIF